MPYIEDFVQLCLAQAGDRYVFGAEVSPADPDPTRFDCSELVQWATARLGAPMPDGSWLQWRACRDAGTLVPVDVAKRTRGALLFIFSSDPASGGRPRSAHVAVSLGDGTTIEARGTRWGVGSWTVERGWTHAALIPGYEYTAPPLPPAPPPPAPLPPGRDRLHPGEYLVPGQFIVSANQQFMLILQGDGNLVLYNAALHPLWASNTQGRAVNVTVMQDDGNLVTYGPGEWPRNIVWHSNTHGHPASTLVMQDDGNAVIYDPDGATWATGTHGGMAPPPPPPPAPAAPPLRRNLNLGDSGHDVAVAQQRLTDLGYGLGRVDGIFGRRTLAAVTRFQTDHGLAVDGVIGPRTWAEMWS